MQQKGTRGFGLPPLPLRPHAYSAARLPSHLAFSPNSPASRLPTLSHNAPPSPGPSCATALGTTREAQAWRDHSSVTAHSGSHRGAAGGQLSVNHTVYWALWVRGPPPATLPAARGKQNTPREKSNANWNFSERDTPGKRARKGREHRNDYRTM